MGQWHFFGHMWNTGALSTGGHALLYTKSGSTWSLAQTLLNPSDSPDSADYFGGGVALAKTSKDRLVVAHWVTIMPVRTMVRFIRIRTQSPII